MLSKSSIPIIKGTSKKIISNLMHHSFYFICIVVVVSFRCTQRDREIIFFKLFTFFPYIYSSEASVTSKQQANTLKYCLTTALHISPPLLGTYIWLLWFLLEIAALAIVFFISTLRNEVQFSRYIVKIFGLEKFW